MKFNTFKFNQYRFAQIIPSLLFEGSANLSSQPVEIILNGVNGVNTVIGFIYKEVLYITNKAFYTNYIRSILDDTRYVSGD